MLSSFPKFILTQHILLTVLCTAYVTQLKVLHTFYEEPIQKLYSRSSGSDNRLIAISQWSTYIYSDMYHK